MRIPSKRTESALTIHCYVVCKHLLENPCEITNFLIMILDMIWMRTENSKIVKVANSIEFSFLHPHNLKRIFSVGIFSAFFFFISKEYLFMVVSEFRLKRSKHNIYFLFVLMYSSHSWDSFLFKQRYRTTSRKQKKNKSLGNFL